MSSYCSLDNSLITNGLEVNLILRGVTKFTGGAQSANTEMENVKIVKMAKTN